MLEALFFCFAMLTFLLRKNVQTWVLVFLQSKNLDFVKKTSHKKHHIFFYKILALVLPRNSFRNQTSNLVFIFLSKTTFYKNIFEEAGNAIRTRDILVGNEMLYR